MSYRSLQLCSSGGAYEAIPETRLRVDLLRVKHALESGGRTVVDARVMLILPGEPEVTITQGGKIVVKTRDSRTAERAFQQLLPFLEPPAPHP